VQNDGFQYRYGSADLFVFPPTINPLHRWFVGVQDTFFYFVQGEFYQECNIQKLIDSIKDQHNQLVNEKKLSAFLLGLNGVFSGFILNVETGHSLHFSDRFGFGIQYLAHTPYSSVFSSSLWPFIDMSRLNGGLNIDAIHDILLFGYPLLHETPFSAVSVVLPGTITKLCGANRKTIPYATYGRIRSPGHWTDIKERFRETFSQHFQSIQALTKQEQFGLALSGGHDSRVILNAMLVNDVISHCLIGYDRHMSPDAKRAAWVARAAHANMTLVDIAEWTEQMKVDTNVLADGAGVGQLSVNLARRGSEYIDYLYFGSTGDLLSGAWHVVPDRYKNVQELAQAVFGANYEYATPVEKFIEIFRNKTLKDVQSRYKRTFDIDVADLREAYVAQRVVSRNFRRIRQFMQGAYLYINPVHMFHDVRIADLYQSLPYKLLEKQRAHIRLSFQGARTHALLPATKYPIPVILEPIMLRPMKQIMLQSSIKARLKRKIGFGRGKSFIGRENLGYIRDMAATLELDTKLLGSFMEKDSSAALIALRINYVVTMLNPERLVNQSELFGSKVLTLQKL
jgi:hypothetical protein